MNREEAAKEIIRVLQKPATSTGVGTGGSRFEQALCLAVDALRQDWVRTAERLPDISEGDFDALIVWPDQTHNSLHRYGLYKASEILAHPKRFLAYMPLPPLPENAGVDTTKSNG